MEVFNVVFDLIMHFLRRRVIIYLFQGLIEVKDRFSGKKKIVEAGFIALSMTFYIATNYVPSVKIILYGNVEGMTESRASILPLFISLTLMLLYCLYFYGGKRSRICYLITTAYALNELVSFTCHSLFVAESDNVMNLLTYYLEKENKFAIRHFRLIFGLHQALWNIAFQIITCFLFYQAVRALRKNLLYVGKSPGNVREMFLAVPTVTGLCYPILLRSIMYAYRGSRANFLMDEYPETRLLIPIISGLCLSSILLSAYILKKLVESNEKEMLVEVYQNRICDMEDHMKDVERLYEGIRGMRHDMKNHVADLELLLNQNQGLTDGDRGGTGEEIRRYLDGLCDAMEELDMKCSTGNPVTDVVVSRKMRKAEKEKIDFECNFLFPENLGISAFDVSILLNNGLDNALEAAGKEENPYIRLDSYRKENMFFIEIRNAFTGSPLPDETGRFLKTSKADTSIHGLGIKNMANCAEKYYGTLRWERQNGEFLLVIMLQGNGGKDEYKRD